MRNPTTMSEPPLPTLRESGDALGTRLARIGAAAVTLREVTADLREGSSRQSLLSLLEDIERDIVLASRQLLIVRQAAREPTDG